MEHSKEWVSGVPTILDSWGIKLTAASHAGVTLVDFLFKGPLRNLKAEGTITPEQQEILTHLLDYTGNAIWGGYFFLLAISLDAMLLSLEKGRNMRWISQLRSLIPYVVLTALTAYLVDVETLQALPYLPSPSLFEAGSAQWGDLPAGLLGVVGGAALFEYYKRWSVSSAEHKNVESKLGRSRQ